VWKELNQLWLALKMEEGAISQRMWAASTNWERQGPGFSPGACRKECSPVDTTVLACWDPRQTSGFQKCICCCCFWRDWALSLPSRHSTTLSHTCSPFCSGYFGDGVSWTICLGWPQTSILPISASQVARITSVSHQPPAQKCNFYAILCQSLW
jgi:hypothetical protein